MKKSKFVWQELFSNDSGKSSMSAFAGIITVLVSCTGFIIGCITKNNEILSASNMFIMAGCGLLGIRKFINNKENDISNNEGEVEKK